MEHVLRRALVRIQSESGKRQRDIKEACAEVLAALDEDDAALAGISSIPPRIVGYRNTHLKALQVACESGHSKITIIALDTISKLCAHGYFLDLIVEQESEFSPESFLPSNGNLSMNLDGVHSAPSTPSASQYSMTLADVIVETICKCDLDNDGIQLQMIKALLAVVTSESLEVHEASLLLSVRTIYTICLSTQNAVNKMTAKASLQQLLSYVFGRMEQCDARIKNSAANVEGESSSSLKQNEKKTTPLRSSRNIDPDQITIHSNVAVERTQAKCPDTMYPSVFELLKFGEIKANLVPNRDPHWRLELPIGSFLSVIHRDAFLILRALCKLSMNNDQTSSTRQLASKTLSLELLLSILEGCGPAFRTDEKFINAVTQYLCVSVLKNCTSSNTDIVGLSLKLFVLLSQQFKEHLKTEIEVFITNVFLRILESGNSTHEHKRLVLEVVCTICAVPVSLTELFLNYDCDTGAIDLYARIVGALSKVAKGRALPMDAPYSTLIREETQLRSAGLQGLVHILTSMLALFGGPNSNQFTNSSDASSVSSEGEDGPEDGNLGEKTLSNSGKSPNLASIGTTFNSSSSLDSNMSSLVHEFDKKRRLEGELANGYVRFNLNPAKGLSYFESRGVLEHTPQGVASFLHAHADRLDKAAIGDYLAKEKEYKEGFCMKVLHEYVDQLHFTGMRFDEAIRHYLSGFRLPGEAQKIDRMMEKFAERYCLQNPSVFPSADTAFILAFSVIMLNTDLHNPAIREDRRMTKAGFIGNNRGIAAGGNLDEAFLEEIFDRIKANPISLKEDDVWRAKLKVAAGAMESAFSPLYATLTGISLADRAKREAFEKERLDMVRASEALVRQRKLASLVNGSNTSQRSVLVPELSTTGSVGGHALLYGDETGQYIRAMFEVAWWPMLGAFSQILKEYGDWSSWEEQAEMGSGLGSIMEAQHSMERSMIRMCLLGCRYGIRLAALCAERAGSEEAKVARETFINGLAKFTLLDTVSEMSPKNVECIRTLLAIATEDGDYLGESWGSVLRYISQLARLLLFAGNLHMDDVFFSNDGENSVHSDSSVSKLTRRSSSEFSWVNIGTSMFYRSSKVGELAREVERGNAELVSSMVDQAAIDRVFSSSVSLSNAGIRHLVQQLCAVSNQEIHHRRQATFRSKEASGDMAAPRIFSLQRLVEVADFNMDSRSRIVWADIWGILSNHFAAIGSHDNPQVAMYAIDSLRQLAHKFTAKEELRDFNFQRLFMRPFETIMVMSTRIEIREFVLRCVEYLMRSRLSSIRSGWKSIFAVYSVAARDVNDNIAKMAWTTIEDLTKKHMESLVFDFLELVKCLLSFVEGPREDLALYSVNLIGLLTKYLAPNSNIKIIEPNIHLHITRKKSSLDGLAGLQLWWPVLFGLSENVGNSSLSLRHACLNVLWNVLAEYGGFFSTQTWGLLFKGVLSPMMENAAMDVSGRKRSSLPENECVMTGIGGGWVIDTAPKVLHICCELFFMHERITRPLLPEMLGLLQSCICQPDEMLARMGLEALTNFMIKLEENEREKDTIEDVIIRPNNTGGSIGKSFTVWDCLSASLSVMLIDNLPTEVLENDQVKSSEGITYSNLSPCVSPTRVVRCFSRENSNEMGVREPNFDALMTMFVVGIRLLPLIEGIICCHSQSVKLSNENLEMLVNAIENSAKVCRRFNNSFVLRRSFGALGFLTPDSGPRGACEGLKQEARSYETLLRCLTFLGGKNSSDDSILWSQSPKRVSKMCKTILLMYSAREKKLKELIHNGEKSRSDAEMMKNLVVSMDSVVIEALKLVQTWTDENVCIERDWVYDALVGLITCDSSLIREQVHLLFSTRISGLVRAAVS